MTLASQAHELIQVFRKIVSVLDCYDHDGKQNYTRSLTDRIRPLAAQFETAVISERDRVAADGVLANVSEIMREVIGAASHMGIPFGDALDRYVELSTLFRESRFSGENL